MPECPNESSGLLELDPVAEGIAGVEPAHAGDLAVRGDAGVAPGGGGGGEAGGGAGGRAGARPSRSSASSAGCALRAGQNGSSTPRCRTAAPDANQQPPRTARAAGLGTSVIPSSPAEKDRAS